MVGQHPQLPLSLGLREASSFDSFVVGPNGALVSALRRLAGGGQGSLYLWGAAGSGRSHLLEAAVRQVLGQGETACLVPGRELLQAAPAVLEGLEETRLVAIDDLELLADDRLWEEALFHLYNRVIGQGGRLLFAAHAPPREAGFRLADLASRLSAAPVFQLLPLDDAQLAGLLQARAAARGLAMAEPLARFVVMRSPREPGALLACLDRLDRAALAHQRRLTQPFVKEVLGW